MPEKLKKNIANDKNAVTKRDLKYDDEDDKEYDINKKNTMKMPSNMILMSRKIVKLKKNENDEIENCCINCVTF